MKDGKITAYLPISTFTGSGSNYSATFNVPIKPIYAYAVVAGGPPTMTSLVAADALVGERIVGEDLASIPVSSFGANVEEAPSAADASAGSGFSCQPTLLKFATTGGGGGGGGGIVTVATQTYLRSVLVSIYDEKTLDEYDTAVESGSFHVFVDPDLVLRSGTFSVYVSTMGSLRKKLILTIDANGYLNLNASSVTLKMGDLNGDNAVTQDEVDYVQSKIGTDLTLPGNAFGPFPFTDNQILFPYMADLNGDRQVTSTDYTLASSNLGQVGD